MAGIRFEDYLIEEISYKKNSNFDSKIDIELNTDISAQINIHTNEIADVILNVIVGNLDENDSPFKITTVAIGRFIFNSDESNDIPFEQFLAENSIAILFPYVRNLVSDISLKSNEFPSLIMPVINIVKLLQNRDSLIINDLRKKETGT